MADVWLLINWSDHVLCTDCVGICGLSRFFYSEDQLLLWPVPSVCVDLSWHIQTVK